MLPGFIPRLRDSLMLALSPPPPVAETPSPATTSLSRRLRPSRAPSHPYSTLLPLRSHISILNDPSLTLASATISPEAPTPARRSSTSGTAPAFAPSLISWVGGSLAGSLRAGAANEVARERWDEAREQRIKAQIKARRRTTSGKAKVEGLPMQERQEGQEGVEQEEEEEFDDDSARRGGTEVLGDWTRSGW